MVLTENGNECAEITHFFESRIIDDIPQLLKDSYNLRYQVYCVERRFLPEENYPEGAETDEFDAASQHIGALNTNGKLVGTVRLIQPDHVGLPMYKTCKIFPDMVTRLHAIGKLAEVSRLSISRYYRRRHGDGYYGAEEIGKDEYQPPENVTAVRDNPLLVVSMYKAIYQTSKRNGITHLLAATEKSLQRLLFRYKFPFHAIGPEVDYFGPVTPYILDLEELDRKLSAHHVPILEEFLDGLEPKFWPKLAQQ